MGDAAILDIRTDVLEPFIRVTPTAWRDVARVLREDPEFAFDALMCLSGVDYPKDNELEVVYHLYSFRHRHRIAIKIRVSRENPEVPSVADIWRTAEWHEREAYDMFGIRFTGHPDLRRILLPEDWEGYPLRKDYQVQAYYHDIPVPYDVRRDFGKGTWVFADEETGSAAPSAVTHEEDTP